MLRLLAEWKSRDVWRLLTEKEILPMCARQWMINRLEKAPGEGVLGQWVSQGSAADISVTSDSHSLFKLKGKVQESLDFQISPGQKVL